jgi:colicin import membrane protein
MTKLNDPGRSLEATRDPFFYGWRPVQRTMSDGSLVLENLPLTQEDVLHPREGDVIVQNTAHDRDTVYLREVLRNRLLSNPGALVLHDAGVDLGLLGITLVCPDICVVFGVRNRDAQRGSFDTVAEGARPALVIEVVSPSTRANDFGKKMEYYYRALVPMYVILDRLDLEGPVTLHGYTSGKDGYEEVNLDDRGRLWLESVGLWLGIGPNRVVCFDGNDEVGDYDEVTRRLIAADQARLAAEEARLASEEAAKAQIAQEKQAREAAEAQAANAKTQMAQEEQARETAEAQTANAKTQMAQEKQARETAEAQTTNAKAQIAQEKQAREAAEAQAANAKTQMAQEKQAREAAEAQNAKLLARLAALEEERRGSDPPTP